MVSWFAKSANKECYANCGGNFPSFQYKNLKVSPEGEGFKPIAGTINGLSPQKMWAVEKNMKSPIFWYRLSSLLHRVGVPIAPNLITLACRLVYSTYMPHTAKIGRNTTLGYGGLGIVIHANAIIGSHVEIGHMVSIAGNARQPGAPVIDDHVYIGCGAKILGPVHIGEGSVIAANATVLHDVAPKSVVAGCPAKVIKENIQISDYLFHRRAPKNPEVSI